MTGAHKEGLARPKYFRLNQLEGETDFATNEELDNCKRFKLIQLRDQGVSRDVFPVSQSLELNLFLTLLARDCLKSVCIKRKWLPHSLVFNYFDDLSRNDSHCRIKDRSIKCC